MPIDTRIGTSASRGSWPEIASGRRAGGGSGKCANPLGCRYGRCFGNAVAGAVGVAESAETPGTHRGMSGGKGAKGEIGRAHV